MKKILIIILFVTPGIICLQMDVKAENIKKDTIYKIGDFLIQADDTMKIDLVKKNKHNELSPGKRNVLYEDRRYIILGNPDKLDANGIYKKYKVPFKFSEFTVKVYKGKLAPPNFKTDPDALLFKTQIKNQCKSKGINFAGHFTVAEWGCGTECELIAIIDRISGKINYTNIIKATDDNFNVLKYSSNSKMMIMNSWLLDDHKGFVLCNQRWPLKIARWQDSKFNFLLK